MRNWFFDVSRLECYIESWSDNLTEYEYLLKNSSISTYLTIYYEFIMFVCLRAEYAA